jgi:hypothetical protein
MCGPCNVLPDRICEQGIINAGLRRHASAIVPIDHTVTVTLSQDLPLSIVHNGLSIDEPVQELSPRGVDESVRIGFQGGGFR